jgi:hypothetical protein
MSERFMEDDGVFLSTLMERLTWLVYRLAIPDVPRDFFKLFSGELQV